MATSPSRFQCNIPGSLSQLPLPALTPGSKSSPGHTSPKLHMMWYGLSGRTQLAPEVPKKGIARRQTRGSGGRRGGNLSEMLCSHEEKDGSPTRIGWNFAWDSAQSSQKRVREGLSKPRTTDELRVNSSIWPWARMRSLVAWGVRTSMPAFYFIMLRFLLGERFVGEPGPWSEGFH